MTVHSFNTQYSRTVLIIFPLTSSQMLSTGGEGADEHRGSREHRCKVWLHKYCKTRVAYCPQPDSMYRLQHAKVFPLNFKLILRFS